MKKVFVVVVATVFLFLAADPASAHSRKDMKAKSKASSRPYYHNYQPRPEQGWERCHKAAQKINYPIWQQGWKIECRPGEVLPGRPFVMGACWCRPGTHWSRIRIVVDTSPRWSDYQVAFVLAHEIAHAHFSQYEPHRYFDASGNVDERAADLWAYEHLQ